MVLLNLLPFFSIITTNELIIVLVAILLIFITLFYLRKMQVLSDGSCIRINRPQLSAQSMVKIENPFMFKLSEESISCDNYKNGVQLLISCDSSFWVMSYWFVDIDQLHSGLEIDWQSMRHSLIDSKFINNSYLLENNHEIYHECHEEVKHLVKPPEDVGSEVLGPNPRTRYPLVVILVRNDDDEGTEVNDNDVVSLITIIHLKDSVIRSNTSIITQYLKQRSGQIFNLQEIFTPETGFDSQQIRYCVICQSTPISHALLPCRHACVCGLCFERIDKCPLCRSGITSFFKISEQQNDGCDESETESTVDNSNLTSNNSWFSSFNSKLNQWFGMN